MSLYLEGTRKAKVGSCVSSRELCRSFMPHTERSEVQIVRGRLVAWDSLTKETEARSFLTFVLTLGWWNGAGEFRRGSCVRGLERQELGCEMNRQGSD